MYEMLRKLVPSRYRGAVDENSNSNSGNDSKEHMRVERSKGSATSPQEKLYGYHQLAKDIVERAVSADEAGQFSRSLPLYSKALEVMREALRLQVPSSGLGPRADNATKWKKDLLTWEEQISGRMRAIQSGEATTSGTSTKAAPRALKTQVPRTKVKVTGQKRAQRPSAPPRSGQNANTRKTEGASGGGGEADKYRDMIMGEILLTNPGISWDDIAGLRVAKQALYESVILPTLRSDLFQGLRTPPRGLLLYGPPGNGKTLLAKALASEAKATFFNISASSLTSKWVGEGEKLVRALFQQANENQPSIIFIDEIDSILSARSASENDAMRRLKTEILVQFDGVASGDSRVVVIGATNRPQELDDAARRRLVKRIYIPLPDPESRNAIISHLFSKQSHALSAGDIRRIVAVTEGYSGSDLNALCKEAAMVAIRELGDGVKSVKADRLRPVVVEDFHEALEVIRPSTNREMLQGFDDFTAEFGTQ
ncbi:hypothetical protein BSKO_11130 [Bryopsis sp. KO-2023]|nr:hypothetical protein BSKO_11130 [Bryopsis sp. KO-2023]